MLLINVQHLCWSVWDGIRLILSTGTNELTSVCVCFEEILVVLKDLLTNLKITLLSSFWWFLWSCVCLHMWLKSTLFILYNQNCRMFVALHQGISLSIFRHSFYETKRIKGTHWQPSSDHIQPMNYIPVICSSRTFISRPCHATPLSPAADSQVSPESERLTLLIDFSLCWQQYEGAHPFNIKPTGSWKTVLSSPQNDGLGGCVWLCFLFPPTPSTPLTRLLLCSQWQPMHAPGSDWG